MRGPLRYRLRRGGRHGCLHAPRPDQGPPLREPRRLSQPAPQHVRGSRVDLRRADRAPLCSRGPDVERADCNPRGHPPGSYGGRAANARRLDRAADGSRRHGTRTGGRPRRRRRPRGRGGQSAARGGGVGGRRAATDGARHGRAGARVARTGRGGSCASAIPHVARGRRLRVTPRSRRGRWARVVAMGAMSRWPARDVPAAGFTQEALAFLVAAARLGCGSISEALVLGSHGGRGYAVRLARPAQGAA